MATPDSDHELLGSADPRDFEGFYRRYVDVVTLYVSRRTGRADLTVDVVAETFARALANRRRFDPDRGPAVAWLLWIARNLIIDGARHGRVAGDARERLRMEPVVLDDDGFRRVEERSQIDIEAALAVLPAEQRDAVRRRILDEEPYPLIAAKTGCSEQVVRQRVSRGLAGLRRNLERS